MPLAFDAFWRAGYRRQRQLHTLERNQVFPYGLHGCSQPHLPTVYICAGHPKLARPSCAYAGLATVYVGHGSQLGYHWSSQPGDVGSRPDYYWLMVDDEPSFSPPVNFSIKTRTLGAAPCSTHSIPTMRSTICKTGLSTTGACRRSAMASRWGLTHAGKCATTALSLSFNPSSTISPIYPRNGYQAVASPPVLGWLPVLVNGTQDASNYHVQVSRTPDFTDIVDEAYPAL